jgi:hypothetical protein
MITPGMILDFPGGKRVAIDRVMNGKVYYRWWHHSAPQDAEWLQMDADDFAAQVEMHGGRPFMLQ